MKINGYIIPQFSEEEMKVIRQAIFDTKTRYFLRMMKKDKRSTDYKNDKKTISILNNFYTEIQD